MARSHPFAVLSAGRLPGRRGRRAACTGALVLALVDVVLAGAREPALRLGPVEVELAEQAVEGFRYLLLATAAVLASSARGLLLGKRQAWRWAVAGAAASLAAHHLKGADAVGDLAALALLGLLVVGRRWFGAANDPATARRALLWLATGEALVFAYGVMGTYLLDAQFREPTGIGDAMVNAARLLFVLPAAAVAPISRHGVWFVDSVRALAIGVLVVGVARTLRSVALQPARTEAERAHVRDLLEHHATTSLAYFHLLDDKRHFFSDDGGAVISYKVVGGVAVALGEPIGEPASCRSAAAAFARHCELNGWRFCYHQVSPPAAEWLAAGGLHALKVGEEAIVELPCFDLSSPHFKSVRNKTAKLLRDGVHVEELVQPIDEETMSELAGVSDAWLVEGGHRERTFTVGRFDPSYMRSTTVLVARSGGGRIEAFVNVLPSFGSDEGNFDLMRRRPDAPRNVMDLLFLALIERFAGLGLAGLNLGLAPLANIEGGGVAERVLRVLYDQGEAAFHFRGLRAFKAKWLPRWEPRYLVYPTESGLPEAALAVTRAGELARPSSLLRRIAEAASRLARAGRRLPLSLGLVGTIVALQLLAVDRSVHRWLFRHLAVGWPDLGGRGPWRLVTATFVQDKPGLRLSILVPLALLPVAEWRLGRARTAAAFFLGDWLSTAATLGALRLAGALGSGPALAAAVARQAGSSSAAVAVAAALVASVDDRRRRRRLQALLAGVLAVSLGLLHRLPEWEHVVAALVGTGAYRCSVRARPREAAAPGGRTVARGRT